MSTGYLDLDEYQQVHHASPRSQSLLRSRMNELSIGVYGKGGPLSSLTQPHNSAQSNKRAMVENLSQKAGLGNTLCHILKTTDGRLRFLWG